MDKYVVIIPNTITPYGYETVPILAYPEGFKYRFRFDEEWVETPMIHRSDLKGKKGYIVLRDYDTGRLYPIRHFSLSCFQKIGKIFYMETELGKLVSYDSETPHRKTQEDSFNEKFNEFNSKVIQGNPPGDDMKPLVFLTNFQCDIQNEHKSSDVDEEMESFGNILSCFKDITFFVDVQFLRLVQALPLDSKVGEAHFGEGNLVLKEGADYQIQIAQFITKASGPEVSQTNIEITGDNQIISVLRGVQRAVGKYDLLTFVVRVHSHGRAGATFLDIQHHPKPTLQGIGEPHLYVPVKITKSKQKLATRILLLGFFCLLYVGPSLPAIFPWDWVTRYAEVIKDFSIIGLTVSLVSVTREIRRGNY